MRDDDHPDEPTGHARESRSPDAAARAVAQAKERLNEGVTHFKRLDRMGQLYLGALGGVIVFGMLFNSVRFPDPEAYLKSVGHTSGRSPLAGAGNPGMLMMLTDLGGIGVYVWNLKSAAKPTWVPITLAGCAGVVLLMILVATMRGSEIEGVKVSRTVLGFWVPLLAAGTATYASMKPILDARPKAPTSPSLPPPPPPPME